LFLGLTSEPHYALPRVGTTTVGVKTVALVDLEDVILGKIRSDGILSPK